MVVVFGSRLYGKVDNVQGLFHVATRFGHFDYFPLFPMGSWVVTEKSGDGWRGVPIPVSIKSVLMGWMRAAAIFMLVFGAFGMVMSISELQRSRPTPARVLPSGRVVPARSNGGAAVSGVVFSTTIVLAALFVLFGSRYVPGLGKATPIAPRSLRACSATAKRSARRCGTTCSRRPADSKCCPRAVFNKSPPPDINFHAGSER